MGCICMCSALGGVDGSLSAQPFVASASLESSKLCIDLREGHVVGLEWIQEVNEEEDLLLGSGFLLVLGLQRLALYRRDVWRAYLFVGLCFCVCWFGVSGSVLRT